MHRGVSRRLEGGPALSLKLHLRDFRLYRHRVRFLVIEAQSPLGLWKQIRHRVFKYPAFIVDGEKTYVGFDCGELGALIDERIKGESRS